MSSITVAYADPPYPGCAKRYPEKTEVDHVELIGRLTREYPDGWALSTSSPSLRRLLPLCPEKARVGAWVKPFAAGRPNVNPIYAWEPVIFIPGRKGKANPLVDKDWVSVLGTEGKRQRVLGEKPEYFSFWLFTCLGLQPGDTLDDLFPGSGAVSEAWRSYQDQYPSFIAAAAARKSWRKVVR